MPEVLWQEDASQDKRECACARHSQSLEESSSLLLPFLHRPLRIDKFDEESKSISATMLQNCSRTLERGVGE